jgi:hypothetical protein
MFSLSTFDVAAAVLFIVGCALLFCVRYIGTRVTKQSTHNERNTNE